MNDKEEVLYIQGNRQAWLNMMKECLNHLGYDDFKEVAWVTEREDAIAQLRDICGTFGDNDWPNSLHLGDIIEKHLGKHLFGNEDE